MLDFVIESAINWCSTTLACLHIDNTIEDIKVKIGQKGEKVPP